MQKNFDSSVCLFIIILLITIFWTTSSKYVQNDGIANFGAFKDDVFGCNHNLEQDGCVQPPSWNTSMNNNAIVNGTYSDSNRIDEVINLSVLKTEDLIVSDDTETHKKTSESFASLADNLIVSGNDKPLVDMRDISVDIWRKDNNNKNLKNDITADLREYQQNYNEIDDVQDNNFKKMTIDDHRKQNIQEWETNMRQRTTELQQQ